MISTKFNLNNQGKSENRTKLTELYSIAQVLPNCGKKLA